MSKYCNRETGETVDAIRYTGEGTSDVFHLVDKEMPIQSIGVSKAVGLTLVFQHGGMIVIPVGHWVVIDENGGCQEMSPLDFITTYNPVISDGVVIRTPFNEWLFWREAFHANLINEFELNHKRDEVRARMGLPKWET